MDKIDPDQSLPEDYQPPQMEKVYTAASNKKKKVHKSQLCLMDEDDDYDETGLKTKMAKQIKPNKSFKNINSNENVNSYLMLIQQYKQPYTTPNDISVTESQTQNNFNGQLIYKIDEEIPLQFSEKSTQKLPQKGDQS